MVHALSVLDPLKTPRSDSQIGPRKALRVPHKMMGQRSLHQLSPGTACCLTLTWHRLLPHPHVAPPAASPSPGATCWFLRSESEREDASCTAARPRPQYPEGDRRAGPRQHPVNIFNRSDRAAINLEEHVTRLHSRLRSGRIEVHLDRTDDVTLFKAD